MFLLVTAIATATATATTLCAGPLRVLRVVLQSATTCLWGWASGGVCLPRWASVDPRLSERCGGALLADLACGSFPGAALDNWIRRGGRRSELR